MAIKQSYLAARAECMNMEMVKPLCYTCKVNGVIICTATKSRGGKCNKGELSLEEAVERKRLIICYRYDVACAISVEL